jgi:hypothetical protein
MCSKTLQNYFLFAEMGGPLFYRGGQAHLFFESAIAIPQLFKEMLLRNRKSAIPQSQFFLKFAAWPQFLAYFWPWNPVDSLKKSDVKNLVLLAL